ncbi:MAG: iron ABC transporter permease, partial [Alphaproteobacteria bacterium]
MSVSVPAFGLPGVFQRPRDFGWGVFALLVAGLIAIPVLVVAAHVFVPTGDVWAHLAQTVLFDYISNSVWLLLGVGAGTLII